MAIATLDRVYQIVNRLKESCLRQNGLTLFVQLDNAMNVGSSGLEILGGLRHVLINNRKEAENLLGVNGREEIEDVIAFIDSAYGRTTA